MVKIPPKGKEPFYNYSTQKLFDVAHRKFRHAVSFFDLIQEGDRVIIAMSGGVDSTMLFLFMTSRRNWWHGKIDIIPVHISSGFNFDRTILKKIGDICEANGYPLHVEYRDIQSKAFAEDARFKPCFICSRMRRKALFETAEIMGANKVALGHHRDDVVETFFLNMMYSRELSAIVPLQELFQGKYHLIRPMFLIEEVYLKTYAKRRSLPKFKRICPADGHTRRDYVRTILNDMYDSDIKIKKNLFRSLFRPKEKYLLERYNELLKKL